LGGVVNPVDVKAVSEANEEFYAAFEALDMDRMEACWRHDDEVRCIHPGWDMMSGWPQVSRSWLAIFANSGYIQFFLTDVRVHVDADTAWVTCVENILSGSAGGPDIEDAKVLATNVFRRDNGRWRMVLRHGSPVLRP
jgi:ketosteroid isomerase-like protein